VAILRCVVQGPSFLAGVAKVHVCAHPKQRLHTLDPLPPHGPEQRSLPLLVPLVGVRRPGAAAAEPLDAQVAMAL